jgi:hypothetical protein
MCVNLDGGSARGLRSTRAYRPAGPWSGGRRPNKTCAVATVTGARRADLDVIVLANCVYECVP